MDIGELIKSPDIDKNQHPQRIKNLPLENGISATTLYNSTSILEDSDDNNEVGLSHWLKTRRNFTLHHKPYNSKANAALLYKNHPSLADVEIGHFDTVYHSLVTGRKFQQPMPLSFVMLVILHGWRKEGLVSSTSSRFSSLNSLLGLDLILSTS